MDEVFLGIEGLSKSFSGYTVLYPFYLTIHPGEFHALIGENGAGKSTLINLLTGIYEPDGGTILVTGQRYRKLSPPQAKKLNIQAVHQELSLNRNLTVTENIFLGDELIYAHFLRDKKKMRHQTEALLTDMNLSFIDPGAYVSSLSLPEQQLLEFAKAISKNPRLLILDEATSALNGDQVKLLFDRLQALKSSGLAVLFISHRLNELFELCDIMTVLKDGQQVVTEKIGNYDQNRLVSLMTGREFSDLFPPKDLKRLKGAPEVLRIEGLGTRHLEDVNLTVRRGEILGIGGLAGQGQQYILECLSGIEKVRRGTIFLQGNPVRIRGPAGAMKHGIAYLPAERKTEGLFMFHPIRFNMSFARFDELSNRIGHIDRKREREDNASMEKRMQIRMRDMGQLVEELSGGNQQKVVVGKWLLRNPEILLLNDPTRGIDVGTKKQIYELLSGLSRQGVTVLLISSDTLELIGLCDRVIVMYENRVNSDINGEDLSEENLVHASVFSRGEDSHGIN
jgi:ABC-type sugar transport system ATPase subunit